MKFARYLEENVVVEWRKAYINYRGLKKVIKLVNARYKARISLDLSRQSTKASSKSLITNTLEGLRRRPGRRGSNVGSDELNDSTFLTQGIRVDQSYGINGIGDAQTNDDERSKNLPQISLNGTGLVLSSKIEPQRAVSSGSDNAKDSSIDDNNAHSAISHPDPDIEAEASPIHKVPISHDLSNSISGLLNRHTRHQSETKKTKGKKRTSKVVSLEAIISENFDDQEQLFFKALDSELERIIEFYEQRERDMAKRYEMLARQLQELSEHRREYKQIHQEHWTDLGHRLSHFVSRPMSQPAQVLKRASLHITRPTSGRQSPMPDASKKIEDASDEVRISIDEGDRRRAAALSRMFNVTGGGLSEAEDEELRRLNKAAAQSHDPERYKAARKKLKAVILEYYRGLEILKNYKILNRTGFAKILKKFEKTVQVGCADAYYNAKVAPSVLVTSESVEKLIKGTEEIFTAYFEHGNRKKALQRLRINASVISGEHSSTHHLSVARAGFYLGITLCAVVGGLIEYFKPDILETIPQKDRLMRVYGAEFIPTLFALLFGLNLAIWHRARINTVFIFEWDVRHALDYHQYFELPAFLLLLLSLAFWVSFINPFPSAIAPTTWPLVWLVVVILIMLNPFPTTQYYSRRWIVFSFGRLFQGGLLYTVEFRDFFLGDELNSINWSISMLWFLGCEYNTGWPAMGQCDPNKTWWTAVLLAVPAFLRFLQCFRRYIDSNYTARLHLINAGKYTSSIFFYFFYINYRYHGSQGSKYLALWCVFGSLYSIYTSTWDITMDWSLLRPHARYPWLRDELVFESYWPFYYWAIVTNIILRFGWVIYLIPGPASNLTRIFIIAFLEMMRRFQWNFLRLENEHLGNVDMYRVSREIPLPYHFKPEKSKEDEDEEEGGGGLGKATKMHKLKSALGGKRFPQGGEHLEANFYSPTPQRASTISDEAKVRDGIETATKGKQRRPSIKILEGEKKDHQVQKELQGDSISRKIIDHLVPDRGGMSATGSRLDEKGVTKGASARDYAPRKLEGDGNQFSSDEEVNGEEDDETSLSSKTARVKDSQKPSKRK